MPTKPQLSYSFIVACNNDDILNSSLLASPDLSPRNEVLVQRNAPSAASAYNRGIDQASGELLIFLHQDVYLPAGWMSRLQRSLDWLEAHDPHWGVAGAFGVRVDGSGAGFLYDTGLGRMVGAPMEQPDEVIALDEVMLILRRSSGLRFDESIPSFHLYGTDIVLQARKRGMKSYGISVFCIHNTNAIRWLPWAYWRAYLCMRRKWWRELPVQTPCMPLERWGGSPMRYFLKRPYNLILFSRIYGRRVADPFSVYRKLAEQGEIGLNSVAD